MRTTRIFLANPVMALVLLGAISLTAAQTNTTTGARGSFAVQPPFIEPAIPQSSFEQPNKPAEGRDPFFPKSMPPYGEPIQKTTPVPTPTAELALKGISGTAEQPLAIINTTTFSKGEEGDVITRVGKIRIRCIEIDMVAGKVQVQAGGQSLDLYLAPK